MLGTRNSLAFGVEAAVGFVLEVLRVSFEFGVLLIIVSEVVEFGGVQF